MLLEFVNNCKCDDLIAVLRMISLRSFNALRSSLNFNIQRSVQYCGFKSRYNTENLYPNSSSDLTVKVDR